MEEFLQKLLLKLNWLNVGDDRLQAEFSAHIGWGLTMALLGHWIAGAVGMYITGSMWIVYSVYKECFEDGHLVRILKGIEPSAEIKDFYTDLLARIVPVLIILAIQYFVRKQ